MRKTTILAAVVLVAGCQTTETKNQISIRGHLPTAEEEAELKVEVDRYYTCIVGKVADYLQISGDAQFITDSAVDDCRPTSTSIMKTGYRMNLSKPFMDGLYSSTLEGGKRIARSALVAIVKKQKN